MKGKQASNNVLQAVKGSVVVQVAYLPTILGSSIVRKHVARKSAGISLCQVSVAMRSSRKCRKGAALLDLHITRAGRYESKPRFFACPSGLVLTMLPACSGDVFIDLESVRGLVKTHQAGLGFVHAHHSDPGKEPGQPVALWLVEKLAAGYDVTLEKVLKKLSGICIS